MDCPICNYPGVNEEATSCPKCNSDLTVFNEIHSMNNKIKKQKKQHNIFFIIIMLVLLGWAYTYFFGSTKTENDLMAESEKKTNQIIELNKEVNRLKNLVSNADSDNPYSVQEEISYSNPTSEAIRRRSLNEVRELDGINDPANEDAYQDFGLENEPKVQYHTVRTGETLYSIAKDVYRDGSKYKKIMADNNITDPTDIKVGQKLKVYPK